MKCIFCHTLLSLDHDAAGIHHPCWNIVERYAKAYQARLQTDGERHIEHALLRRLQRIARHKRLPVRTLIHLYLEMAIAWEEVQYHSAQEEAVKIVEGVITRAIESLPANDVPTTSVAL